MRELAGVPDPDRSSGPGPPGTEAVTGCPDPAGQDHGPTAPRLRLGDALALVPATDRVRIGVRE
jgi:hypothetical protein